LIVASPDRATTVRQPLAIKASKQMATNVKTRVLILTIQLTDGGPP
jgi:hypothetical protein